MIGSGWTGKTGDTETVFIVMQSQVCSIKNREDCFRCCSTICSKLGQIITGLHRCWWRLLVTKCVGGNLKKKPTFWPFLSPTSTFKRCHHQRVSVILYHQVPSITWVWPWLYMQNYAILLKFQAAGSNEVTSSNRAFSLVAWITG